MSEDLHERYHNLLFDVRRSVRYHDKREGFFLAVRNTTDFVVFILGSAAALIITQTIFSDWPIWGKAIVPLTAAVCTGITLVLQVGAKALAHNSLKRRFIALEQKLIACHRNPTAERMDELQMERLSIETDEPPIKRVLDTICHNELIHAMGSDHRDPMLEVSVLQRLFSPFFDFRPKTLYSAQ